MNILLQKTIPYNGKYCTLRSIIIVAELNSDTSFTIVRKDNKQVISVVEIPQSGLVVYEWDNFDDLPQNLTVLELCCKSNNDSNNSKVVALEINM